VTYRLQGIVCPKCGKLGFLTRRRVWSTYRPKFISSDGGLTRQYNYHTYIGHYSPEKYREDMERYRNGRRRSRPNGRIYCYLTDDEESMVLGIRENQTSRALRDIIRSIQKYAEVVKQYPPTDPEDEKWYAEVIREYRQNLQQRFEREGIRVLGSLFGEKEQRVVSWRERRLKEPGISEGRRSEIIQLSQYALAMINPFWAVVLHHRLKYVLPHLQATKNRIAPHLGRFGEDATNFPSSS
jgi:hypothetical protein